MALSGNTIKARRTIFDPVFGEGIPEMHDLYIYIDEAEITCAVADKKDRKFIALESWEFSPENRKAQLEQIRFNSKVLHPENYRNVICCSGFRNSTLVPVPLYEADTAEQHLHLSHRKQQGEVLHTDEILQLEARNIFAIPADCSEIISNWFRHAEIHHTSTALIEYLLTTNRNRNDEIMTVNVHRTYLEIIVIKGRVLLLYNCFNYETPEEFVYYLLFVCEQLHLNPDHVVVQFAGEIEKSDSLFQLTSRYVRNAGMVSRPEILDYSAVIHELPSHFHFNLFSQVICAL